MEGGERRTDFDECGIYKRGRGGLLAGFPTRVQRKRGNDEEWQQQQQPDNDRETTNASQNTNSSIISFMRATLNHKKYVSTAALLLIILGFVAATFDLERTRTNGGGGGGNATAADDDFYFSRDPATATGSKRALINLLLRATNALTLKRDESINETIAIINETSIIRFQNNHGGEGKRS